MSRIRGIIHARKANKATAKRYFTASETDWEHLHDLEVEGIDDSDIPEPTPEQFARAVLRRGLTPVLPKHQVTLRLDVDVLSWFRAQGAGYQPPINQLLRAYDGGPSALRGLGVPQSSPAARGGDQGITALGCPTDGRACHATPLWRGAGVDLHRHPPPGIRTLGQGRNTGTPAFAAVEELGSKGIA